MNTLTSPKGILKTSNVTLNANVQVLRPTESYRSSNESETSNENNFTKLKDDINDEFLDRAILRNTQDTEKNKQDSRDALTSLLSTIYARLLITIGLVLPVANIISKDLVSKPVYHGFYIYLYAVSVAFIAFVYMSKVRLNMKNNVLEEQCDLEKVATHCQHSGSDCLRYGAIVFGIGAIVYSGFELGIYMEQKNQNTFSKYFKAMSPVFRILLGFSQMQFIFLNTSAFDMGVHKNVCRIGLMHCLATNICEWLFVITWEANHDIHDMQNNHSIHPNNHSIINNIVRNTSPFLSPCTIEYSLICAVILYEMWRKVNSLKNIVDAKRRSIKNSLQFGTRVKRHTEAKTITFQRNWESFRGSLTACILICVITIISIVIYFELERIGNDQAAFSTIASLGIVLHVITIIVMIKAFFDTYEMGYVTDKHDEKVKLDNNLLVTSPYGAFVYTLFSLLGSVFSIEDGEKVDVLGLIMELLEIIQMCIQTVFILNIVWKKSNGSVKGKNKILFLLVSNVAMWIINVTVRNRGQYRAKHLHYFTTVGWIIITHMSMPLAIFYRFHSAICLFEMSHMIYSKEENFVKL